MQGRLLAACVPNTPSMKLIPKFLGKALPIRKLGLCFMESPAIALPGDGGYPGRPPLLRHPPLDVVFDQFVAPANPRFLLGELSGLSFGAFKVRL